MCVCVCIGDTYIRVFHVEIYVNSSESEIFLSTYTIRDQLPVTIFMLYSHSLLFAVVIFFFFVSF